MQKKIHITIDDKLLEAIDKCSEELCVSRSAIISISCVTYIRLHLSALKAANSDDWEEKERK